MARYSQVEMQWNHLGLGKSLEGWNQLGSPVSVAVFPLPGGEVAVWIGKPVGRVARLSPAQAEKLAATLVTAAKKTRALRRQTRP